MNPAPVNSLSASIVTFSPDFELLRQTIMSLRIAVHHAKLQSRLGQVTTIIVDNGPGEIWKSRLSSLVDQEIPVLDEGVVKLISGHGNVGYGKGHNIAIRQTSCDYHLILNPDVILNHEALSEALLFMENNPDVGLLAPSVMDSAGETQYLCKRYPSVFDLFLRGFSPAILRRLFRKRLDHYQMKDQIKQEPLRDVPVVSGSFMFLRRAVLDQTGGFSDKYFMYFEDYDLSIRISRIAHIAYVPTVKVVHFGGNAARKGIRHIFMFVRSMFTFFNCHGWRWR